MTGDGRQPVAYESRGRPALPAVAAVELWLADLRACAPSLDVIENITPRLSPDELAKIERSVTPQAAIERRAAYIALRLMIERAFGTSWRGAPYALAGTGKPYLAGAPGDFSLTHVERFALVGICRGGPIGVDLEPVRPRHVADERRQRIEDAARRLAGGAPLPEEREQRLLQAWVRLEALAKCDGRGIGRLLTGLGIIGGQGLASDEAQTYLLEATALYAVHDLSLPDLRDGASVAACALARETAVPEVNALPASPAALSALIGRAAE